MQALVIDDSRITRVILERLLRTLGFEVAEASDGRQGLEELHRLGPIDLILVDGNMPDMDGWTVARTIRADAAYNSLRLLLVTAEQDSNLLRRTLEAGADGYLVKPFTRDGLVDQLRRLGLQPRDV